MITEMTVFAATENAKHYAHKVGEYIKQGYTLEQCRNWILAANGCKHELREMRNQLVQDAGTLNARAALFPADKNAAKMADRYLKWVDQIDAVLKALPEYTVEVVEQ